jgi:hypothetical protein
MSSTIVTGTFYILIMVTVMLQLTMYLKRAKFIRTLKERDRLSLKLNGPGIQGLGTMMQIILPVKLENVQDGQLNELRKSANKVSIYWMISLLTTMTVPILLYKLLE